MFGFNRFMRWFRRSPSLPIPVSDPHGYYSDREIGDLGSGVFRCRRGHITKFPWKWPKAKRCTTCGEAFE